MRLILDLKKEYLYSEDDSLIYNFTRWNYNSKQKEFYLGENRELTISQDILDEIIYDKEKEQIYFEVEIDDLLNVEDIQVLSSKRVYSKDSYLYTLERKIELYLVDNPIDIEDGETEILKGNASVYFDYSEGEYVIDINSLQLLGEM